MSNATANCQPTLVGKEGRKLNIPVKGSTHIYDATMISQVVASGLAVPYSTASSGPCVGVATHEQDNSAGADSAKEIQVEWDREFVFDNGSGGDEILVSTPLGTAIYATDDHTLALTSSSGTRKPVGFFCGLEPDGRVRVFITLEEGHSQLTAADVGALTDNTTGTANTTLEAIVDPTDTPATADALRDNLVATQLPAIRNNFADLAAQVNAIRTALRNAGLMV